MCVPGTCLCMLECSFCLSWSVVFACINSVTVNKQRSHWTGFTSSLCAAVWLWGKTSAQAADWMFAAALSKKKKLVMKWEVTEYGGILNDAWQIYSLGNSFLQTPNLTDELYSAGRLLSHLWNLSGDNIWQQSRSTAHYCRVVGACGRWFDGAVIWTGVTHRQ